MDIGVRIGHERDTGALGGRMTATGIVFLVGKGHGMQFISQLFRLLHVRRVESFHEPSREVRCHIVCFSQCTACSLLQGSVLPQPDKAHDGVQLNRLCVLQCSRRYIPER